MPAIGTITINDGQSTPVAHSFDPVTTNGESSSLADRSGGVPMGYPLILARQKSPNGGAQNYRMSFSVVVPVVEADAVTGQNKVTRTTRFNGEFVLPEGSSLSERKDILAYAKNLLGDSAVQAVVHNLETIY